MKGISESWLFQGTYVSRLTAFRADEHKQKLLKSFSRLSHQIKRKGPDPDDLLHFRGGVVDQRST